MAEHLAPGDTLVLERLTEPDRNGKMWRIGRSIGGNRG